MRGVREIAKKCKSIILGEMDFCKGGGNINWFPGHMAAATKAIRSRLKVTDLVIEVRDARIPLSSVNQDLQPMLTGKSRVIALNKKDLANRNVMHVMMILLFILPVGVECCLTSVVGVLNSAILLFILPVGVECCLTSVVGVLNSAFEL